jgi:hypothetical protein
MVLLAAASSGSYRVQLSTKENAMDARPRTKAAKKRRLRLKEARRLKKTQSKVMPMLSRPMKLRVNKRARAAS